MLAENDEVEKIYLKAIWEPKSYEVHYDLNGGTSAINITPKTVLWDDKGLTPSQLIERLGYTFLRWSVSENGSGDDVNADDVFSSLATDDDVPFITLKAAWEAIPKPPAEKDPIGRDKTPADKGDKDKDTGKDSDKGGSGGSGGSSGGSAGSGGDSKVSAPAEPAEWSADAGLEPSVKPGGDDTSSGGGRADAGLGTIAEPNNDTSAWALINLLLAIIGLLAALIAAAFNIRRRKTSREDGEQESDTVTYRKRKAFPSVTALVFAVIGAIVFILTEDMSKPMRLTDNWTIVMAIIFVFVAIASIFAARKTEGEEEAKAEE
jgi:hypothetical protein